MTLVQDNSVQAINTALLSIKRDISAPTTTTAGTTAGLEPGKTYNINISGNAETATTAKTARTATNANHAETATNANHAETAETATKMSNALTVNGKTYNGSEAVDAGVQTVANGGTGVTTQADINKAFIGNLETGESDVTDGTEFVSSWASDNGFAETTEGAVNTPYKRKFIKVWGYIKDKISSVLGLTANNYGDIQIGSGNITGSKLTIQGLCVSSNSYTDANPKLVFKDEDGSQNISLTFTDFDAVQPPASLTLNGNQGNEYFIAPCIKANNKMRIPIGAPSSLEDGCIWIS